MSYGVWPNYAFLRKILKKNLDKKAWRWRMSNSPSWAQRRNVNQLFQIISIGVWPNYELLRELLKKNINEKAWRWRMSSKSSRHSGVRIRRDKLENAIKSCFSKTYLMGSDLTTHSYEKSWGKILTRNLNDEGCQERDKRVRIRRDKLKNVIKSSFSKPYLMGSDPNTWKSGQNLEDR